MKPTISIALITLGLTFPAPALAVDYVRCDAIASARTRMVNEANRAINNAFLLVSLEEGKARAQAVRREYEPKLAAIDADYKAAGCP